MDKIIARINQIGAEIMHHRFISTFLTYSSFLIAFYIFTNLISSIIFEFLSCVLISENLSRKDNAYIMKFPRKQENWHGKFIRVVRELKETIIQNNRSVHRACVSSAIS